MTQAVLVRKFAASIKTYLRLPGTAANYVNVPDNAVLDITSDIDLRVKCAMTDWTPSAESTLLSKWTNLSAGSAYMLDVGTTGLLRLYLWETAAGSSVNVSSSAATGITNGVARWVRATWRASDGRVQFFTSTDYDADADTGTWDQLGTDRSLAIASLRTNSTAVQVGAFSGSTFNAAGKFYRALIYDGIDDTKVLDLDFTKGPIGATTIVDSANGLIGTINRSGTPNAAMIDEAA